MTVTGSTWVNLLLSIRTVCTQSNVKIAERQLIDCLDNPVIRKIVEDGYNYSLSEVVSQINLFVKENEHLILFEAAKRIHQEDIAHKILITWQQQLEKDVRDQIEKRSKNQTEPFYLSQKGNSVNTIEEIEAKINQIYSNICWPIFSQKGMEEEIGYGLRHVIAREIVFRKFRPEKLETVPQHTLDAMGKLNPSLSEEFIIKTYAHLMKEITFSSPTTLTNREVKIFLKRFSHAKILDLQEGIKLTSDCLEEGHPTLETINLTFTLLEPKDINPEIFPRIQTIKKIDFNKVLNFADLDFESLTLDNWKSFSDSVYKAEKIVCTSEHFEKLLLAVNKAPSMQGINALELFIKCQNKLEDKIPDCEEKIIRLFLSIWNNSTAIDWLGNNPFYKDLVEKLFELWRYGRDKITPKIYTEFYTTLTFTKPHIETCFGEEKKGKELRPITEDFIQRTRYLVKHMRGVKFPLFFKGVKRDLKESIKKVEKELVYKNERGFNDPYGRDPKAIILEFLHEIYADISYHLPYAALLDSHKINLSLAYDSPLDQIHATAFVLNFPERKKLLTNILATFSGYQGGSEFYPLAKIILGTCEPKDIPLWDQNSLIRDRLLAYQGVFCEDIGKELKEAYWNALIAGKLGGITFSLIDGLSLFYRKPNQIHEFKTKTLSALNTIGDVLINGPVTDFQYYNPFNDNEVKAYARKKLKELKGS